MNLLQLQGVLELGLIYGLVAIGIYLSFRVLKFPDLTVDGSFPLGAAVCAAMMTKGMNPPLAMLAAALAGAGVGWITAYLSTALRMLNLLAGILTMSALYSVNLRVMGNKPNLSFLGQPTFFSSLERWFESMGTLAALAILVLVIGGVLIWFLGTHFGLALRAAGSNAKVARAQGINDQKAIRLGLALSNSCVALSGALFAQAYGFADVTLGVGTIIIGLALVIIGEALFPNRTVTQAIVGCVAGAVLYRLLIALALNLGDAGLQASDLNLITAVLVALAMSAPNLKSALKAKTRKIQIRNRVCSN